MQALAFVAARYFPMKPGKHSPALQGWLSLAHLQLSLQYPLYFGNLEEKWVINPNYEQREVLYQYKAL